MWTRAAVAPRNINICEMPSHDGYLGTGHRAGCGRACLMAASPSAGCARERGLGCRLPDQGRGCCGGCVFYGCQPWMPRQSSVGIEGQILCSSLLNMANRTRVAWCPACFPTSECIYTFHPCPAPLLVVCGSSLKSPRLCPVDLGRREAQASWHIPERVQRDVYCLWAPTTFPCRQAHVGSAIALSWGRGWGPAAGQEVGVGGWFKAPATLEVGETLDPPTTGGMTPFCFSS